MSKNQLLTDYFDRIGKSYTKGALARLVKDFECRRLESLISGMYFPKVLDLGCGNAYFLQQHLLNKKISRAVCVDLSIEMLTSIPSANVTKIAIAIENLDLQEKFDLLLALGVIEFSNNPLGIFRAAFRHAERNSLLIILYPKKSWAGSVYRLFHRSHSISVQLFHVNELIELGKQAGWTLSDQHNIHLYAGLIFFRKI